ncbi:unnamed protein product [Urochloa humidicola]
MGLNHGLETKGQRSAAATCPSPPRQQRLQSAGETAAGEKEGGGGGERRLLSVSPNHPHAPTGGTDGCKASEKSCVNPLTVT